MVCMFVADYWDSFTFYFYLTKSTLTVEAYTVVRCWASHIP
jgi:hypothetical protein